MSAKKSPQLLKSKVIGARFSPHEVAFIETQRGDRAPGTYVADLVRVERARQEKKAQKEA